MMLLYSWGDLAGLKVKGSKKSTGIGKKVHVELEVTIAKIQKDGHEGIGGSEFS